MADDSQLRRVREAIEACRAGSDDLRSPELADVAQSLIGDATLRLARRRIEQWDVALGQAMQQVDAPAGLAERILARLAGESTSTLPLSSVVAEVTSAAVSGGDAVSDGIDVSVRPDDAAPPLRVWQLWHWSGVALSAVTAAAVVLAIGYWLRWESDTPLDQLAEQWRVELTSDWQPVVRAPSDLPFPASMRVPPTRWQRIGGLSSTPVVAYELTHGKTRAMLYAARMSRPGLATSPPVKAQHDSGGKAVGWWHSGNVVYVLVVNDVNSYSAFVRPSQTPLAFHPLRPAQPARLRRAA